MPFEPVRSTLAAVIGAVVVAKERESNGSRVLSWLGRGLFAIGLFGALTRRNALPYILSYRDHAQGANLNLVAFGVRLKNGSSTGHGVYTFHHGVAAAEIAVGLALLLSLYRNAKTIDIDEVNLLKDKIT